MDRSHARIKLAASTLAPKDEREAAIIGGLVHCLIASGHFNPGLVVHYANDLARQWQGVTHLDTITPIEVKVGSVNALEMRGIVARYNEAYKTVEVG